MDIHQEIAVSGILDEQGTVLQRHRCRCTREALEQLSRCYWQATDKVAVAATPNTWAVVAILKPFVAAVGVSTPVKTKAMAEATIKTDTVEAEVVAQLLRCDFFPRGGEPPVATQVLRRVTARRAALVMDKTATKNRIPAVLPQRLSPCPCTDLVGLQGRPWLQTLA